MAFIRWRQQNAELLATRYDAGRTRQVRLAILGHARAVHTGLREDIARRFPYLQVDWDSVERALAAGPPGPTPLEAAERLDWLEMEDHLRRWAAAAAPRRSAEADVLLHAASVLNFWRQCNPYFENSPADHTERPKAPTEQ